MRTVFIHEVTHWLESTKGYNEFKKAVFESKAFRKWLNTPTDTKQARYDSLEEYRKKKVKNYGDKGNEYIDQEIIATFVGDNIFSKDMSRLVDFVNEYKGSRRKGIINFIKSIFAKFKNAISGIGKLENKFLSLVNEKVNTTSEQNKTAERKFSVAGENAESAEKLKLSTAKQMEKDGADSETIRKETGWYKGGDGVWRFRIADNEMRFYHNKLGKEPITLGECVKHDKLFKAYPQLKDFTVRLSDIKGNLRGQFNGKEIILNSNLSPIQKKKTLIHEIQHYIQSVENFARGGSKDLGLYYAINDAYSEAIKQPEYKKLKTPDERIDFTFSLAEKRFNVKGIENVAFKAYRNLHGEVEARETSNLMNFNDEVLKYVEPNTSGKVVVNKNDELQKFVDNLQKMGYTEDEVKNVFGGVDNDESRGNETVERRYKNVEESGLGRLRAFFSDSNIGTLQTERTFKGTTGSDRRGVSSSLQISNDEAGLNNNSAFSYGEVSARDNDYMSAVENGDTDKAQEMVDEQAEKAGYTIKAYHGTPNGEFNTFKDWQYFTESKEYADVYQNQGASSNGYKQTANNPRTYEVYIKPEKVFDTRNATEKEIFDNEFYMQWGNGAPLSEKGLPDWTDGDDLIEFFDENGYDYDTILLDEGATGGYGDEVKDRGISIVVKKSNQIKSADAITYDDDGNVIPLSKRFDESDNDIRFSLSDEVEETKDLVAVHNVKENKLLEALNLGGLPSPSIAVMRNNLGGNSDFGDISLVFYSDTIDPETNSKNNVYSSDAYTPIGVKTEYKLNSKLAMDLYSKMNELTKGSYVYKLNPADFHPDNLRNAVNSKGGSKALIEQYKNDYGMKQAFLADTAEPVKEVVKKKEKTTVSNDDKAVFDYLKDNIKSTLDEIDKTELINPKVWREKYDGKVKQAIENYYKELIPGISEDGIENIFNNSEFKATFQRKAFVRRALKYYKNGDTEVKSVEDNSATKKLIDDKVNQKKYEKWLNNLFDKVVEKKGIYNGEDFYTDNGDEKSFEETHWDYTLDNIVRAMNQQDAQGGNFLVKNIFGGSATKYNSLDEIRNDKQRLKTVNQEELETEKSRLNDKFLKISQDMTKGTNADLFAVTDTIVDGISKSKTKDEFRQYLKKELSGWAHYDEKAFNQLCDLVKEIRQLPTEYFEAKPQRAVGFDEVAYAVIPDNSSDELKTRLEENGVKYIEYKNGDEQSRIDALNDDNSVKFSVDDEDIDRYTEKQYNNFGWVRANDVLTSSEYQHFNNSFSDNKNLKFKFTKNPTTKETIIPTGDNANLLNVLVYTKGTFKNPIITKVVRINSNDTTDVAIIRSDILECETRGYKEPYGFIENYYGKVFLEFKRESLPSLQEFKRQRKGKIGAEINSDSGKINNGTESVETNRTDSKAGLNNNSAFSNGKFSVDDESVGPKGDYLGFDEDGEVSWLSAEDYQKELRKNPRMAVLDKQQIELRAKSLLKDFQSKADSTEVATELSKIFTKLKNNPNGWEEIYPQVQDLAKNIYDNIAEQVSTGEVYEQIKDNLQGSPMVYDDDLKSEFSSDWNNFIRSNRAKLNLVKKSSGKGGIGIDVQYENLARELPGYFSGEAIGPKAQLEEILNVYNAQRYVYDTLNSDNESEIINEISSEIMSAYAQIDKIDRKSEKGKAQNEYRFGKDTYFDEDGNGIDPKRYKQDMRTAEQDYIPTRLFFTH